MKHKRHKKKMYGIFKHASGLYFVAASDSFESAVKALYDRSTLRELEKEWTCMEWWNFSGIQLVYTIKEIEVW